MNEIHYEIGNRIRKFRIKNGLSQEKLAELSGLNTSYIGQIERGEKNPSVDTIYNIAKALDIDLTILFENILVSNQSSSYPQRIYSIMLSLDEKHLKLLFDLATLFAEE